MITLSGIPTLETERLRLRAPQPGDADAYLQFYTSDRSQYVGGPKTPRAAWDLFGLQFGHWCLRGYGMFAVTRKEDDAAIGLVGHWFPDTRPETEVGWILFDTGSEGQGIAFEAAQTCVSYGWEVLGWEQMVSYIDPDNARSINLAKRLGAVLDPDAAPAAPDVPCVVYRHRRPA